jgi:histidinol-phosphate phosphatase family protein
VKQALILAGGKGTRLSSRLHGLPKPLVDISGIPLLERQIKLLSRYNYKHIILLVNHGARHIVDFCASHSNWGMHIECIDDGIPLGTAGAILAIFPYLEENFLVMYGDTMLEIDLIRFEDFHNSRSDVDATLFLHPNDHPHDSDLVDLDDDGRIVAFYPYPHQAHQEENYYPNLVNAALYYIRRDALEPWHSMSGTLDFGKDIFPAMLDRGAHLLGYNSAEYIKDCGTPERLDKVCADVISGDIARLSLNVQQMAIFLDRDGTINREISHLSHHQQFEILPGVKHAIKRINSSIYRAVVVTNQPVLARGECSFHELKKIHNKMETLLGYDGAYLDRIYFCPHHPDQGFAGEVAELKINCSCRKPNTGMIMLAKQELNIDLHQSWLIGDSTTDVLTAHRAGLRSILVETGYAGLDYRYSITPDILVPDLRSAVNFILDDYPRIMNIIDEVGCEINDGEFVFIGGLSRSGKSNLASCLKDSLRLKGQKSVVISLDRWLQNSDERLPSVFGRYALNEIAVILRSLANRTGPIELKFPSYEKVKRLRAESGETFRIERQDVVIVEGTVALALLSTIPENVLHAWFVEISEHERKSRVLSEYQLRGMNKNEAEAIYLSRQKDETPLVIATRDQATHCINMELISSLALCSSGGMNDN